MEHNPLGVYYNSPNSTLDTGKIASDIQTRFPKLWQMLELHPLANFKSLSMEEFVAYGKERDPKVDASRSSGVYSGDTDTITLNAGAQAAILHDGAFGEWRDGRVYKTGSQDEFFNGASLSQAREGDLYTAVTIHELGHHFSNLARNDSRTGRSMVADYLASAILGFGPSGYALSGMEEYWAESWASYWLIPDDLKRRFPSIYNTIDAFVDKILQQKEQKAA